MACPIDENEPTTVQVYVDKKGPLEGEHMPRGWTTHLRGRLLCIKCEVKVKVGQYISERAHKPNALRLWVKMWCQLTCAVALDQI